jgi:hypothetical protein
LGVYRRKTAQPFQGCEQSPRALLNPGFQSKPWADISERFQRTSSLGFIGELGNAHFSFRHDVDVTDDCYVRLDNQVVLRFYRHGIL